MKLTAVPGTWAWSRQERAWWQPNSPFWRLLGGKGFEPRRPEPFRWSTDVNGTSWWRRLLPFLSPSGDHNDWAAGGDALRWYINGTPSVVIAHSHGGQLALYAAAAGFHIPVLVTVSTPVRGDMQRVAEWARPNIGYWLHIHASGGDWFQLLGSLGDGRLGTRRAMSLADKNIAVAGINHTKVLEDPKFLALWDSQGWADLIKGEATK